MINRSIIGLGTWLLLICTAEAQTLVFPPLSGRVIDQANIFDETGRTALNQALADFELKTSDQIVVVTLKSLQDTSIEDYGYKLGRQWQIGQKNKNNGALLIVAPSERKVRIEVGYGLEPRLTDALTRGIIEQVILPRFRLGDFSGGVQSGVDEIVRVLSAASDLRADQALSSSSQMIVKPGKKPIPTWLILSALIGFAGLFIYCAIVGGMLCRSLLQILLLVILTGGHGSSRRGSTFSGGGGSFGGGGSSGSW